jgi:hypothetical protein
MELGAQIAIALFMVGVIFQAGRLTVRVEKLEEWREELRVSFDVLHRELGEIKDLVGDRRRER